MDLELRRLLGWPPVRCLANHPPRAGLDMPYTTPTTPTTSPPLPTTTPTTPSLNPWSLSRWDNTMHNNNNGYNGGDGYYAQDDWEPESVVPEKKVEVTWEVKAKRNNSYVLRRIKKKTWTYRIVTYEWHPSVPQDRMLKRIRTYRRTCTRRDTTKCTNPSQTTTTQTSSSSRSPRDASRSKRRSQQQKEGAE